MTAVPDDEKPIWDPRNFVTPDLNWLQYWNASPDLTQVWEQTANYFSDKGGLQELILKNSGNGATGSVMAAIGLSPSVSPANQPYTPHQVDETDRIGGYLHIVPPFMPIEDLRVVGSYSSQSPWTTPNLVMLDVVADSRREEGIFHIVTFEKPTEAFVVPWQHAESLSSNWDRKRFAETTHLERFLTDFLLVTGHSLYDGFEESEEGKDPPDFIVNDLAGRYGLECTQLTLPSRRGAYGLFARLQDAMVESARKNRNKFQKVRGCMVYAFFDSPEAALVLPPKTTDIDFIDRIVERIGEIEMNFQDFWVDRGSDPPEQLRIPAKTVDSCGLYAIPMVGAFPLSRFLIATGFELGLGFTSYHRPDEEWKRLIEIIGRKDRNGHAKHLLITIGGPDERGMCFPSEDYVLGSVIEPRVKAPFLEVIKTSSLENVYLHFWNIGWIVQLVPEIKQISPARFPLGYVPGHMLAGLPSSDDESED